ncbi:MAG: dodecin domain-containing protein [Cyclobacteriaceae bacterium]|nr:dodecin domain-containing protein [Cyclobacteriaceae bacterium]
MKVLKVVELLSNSDKSWEDAAAKAIKKASKSVRGISSINIKNMSARVENDKIVEYRINAKISFELDEK